MATKTAAKPAAKKTPAKKAPARKPAAKAPEPTREVNPDPPFEVTPIDDAVSIQIEDGKAVINIKGTFDLDGVTAVAKRVNRARAEIA